MNFAQEIIFSIISDLELKGVAISLQVLKARQLGITTLAEALIAHRIQFVAEAWGIVGSNDEDKSTRMVAKAELVWLNMPRWLMPQLTVRRAGERIVFGGQLSGLSISHGSAQSGIGRGSTLQCAHLSEVAEYKNAKDLIDDSLLRAMHESPSIFQIFESTAHGVGGWWHDTWEVNKRLYHKGQGKMYPVFLPWYAGKDLYPTKGWMRARPIPADWVPGALTQAHATKAAAYVRNSPLLSKWLGKDWKMPRAQMWFWEVERALAAEKDNLAGFYQEMPADDAEAFQSSGYSVFNTELIAEKREQAKRPLALFGVAGPSYEIPLSMQPDRRDVNRNMPGIDIKANWHPRQKPKEYHLVPLKMDNYPNIDWDKKLMVWEFPEPGETYGIGVDTGFGVGADRTVIQVVRKGTMYRNDAQVAEWASADVNAMDLWPLLMAIGTFYAVPGKDGRVRQPKMVIEIAANGEVAQNELLKRGWRNFHRWTRYDNIKRDHSQARKFGWMTVTWSRAMMLDYFIKAVRDGWLDLNSQELINELSHFQKDENKAKIEAATGQHDDRIMALGIVFFSLNVDDARDLRKDSIAERIRARSEVVRAPGYSLGMQDRDYGLRGEGRDVSPEEDEGMGYLERLGAPGDEYGMDAWREEESSWGDFSFNW
jgi:hypothetical protein